MFYFRFPQSSNQSSGNLGGGSGNVPSGQSGGPGPDQPMFHDDQDDDLYS